VPPGMFSMVIVEISAESVKACSFHQRKAIPDTEIIYSTSFRYNRFTNSSVKNNKISFFLLIGNEVVPRDFDIRVKLIYFSQFYRQYENRDIHVEHSVIHV
jgi:hypothetical protein